MLSESLRARLSPTSLIEAASQSTLGAFLHEHGDTQFLLVSLSGDGGGLRTGLMAMSAIAGQAVHPAQQWLTQETQVAEHRRRPSDTSIPPPQVFDEEALSELLESGPYFAVALRKRVNDGELERIHVGRSTKTDVVLQHSGVSKVHAWLEMDEGGVFYLADNGSTNGTRLNDTPLDRNEMVRVRPGDRVEFGSVVVTLCPPETLWHALKT